MLRVRLAALGQKALLASVGIIIMALGLVMTPVGVMAQQQAGAAAGAGQKQIPLAEQQGRNPLDPIQMGGEDIEKPDWMKMAKDNDPAERAREALDRPHLTPREVKEWASNAVADLLTFSYNDFSQRQEEFPKYFTQSGYEQYQAYLKQSKMEKVLLDFQYSVSGIVVNEPYIAKEEARQGYYRWLVEVPVMMTYLEPGQKGLEEGKIPLTDDLLVTIEIARVPEPEMTAEERNALGMYDAMFVAIHSWVVKRRKRRQ